MSTILTVWDTSVNKDVFKKLVREIFDSTDRDVVLESAKLYKMEKTNDYYERLMRIAGLPAGNYIVEGGKIPMYEPKFGSTKDIYMKEFGMGFRVSWMFRKTNKWNLVERWTRDLKSKMLETKDIELAKLWNSPTSTYTGFDGQPLGSASHTCLDDAGTTYSNLGNTALSVAALEAAEYYFDTLKDDQGLIFYVNTEGMVLYFHPALKVRINEISRSTGKPFEISNTMNFWEGRFELHPYRRLTSTTAWGLAAVKDRRYDIHCYTLEEPTIITKDAADNSIDWLVMAHQAFGWGFGDPRLVYIGNT